MSEKKYNFENKQELIEVLEAASDIVGVYHISVKHVIEMVNSLPDSLVIKNCEKVIDLTLTSFLDTIEGMDFDDDCVQHDDAEFSLSYGKEINLDSCPIDSGSIVLEIGDKIDEMKKSALESVKNELNYREIEKEKEVTIKEE